MKSLRIICLALLATLALAGCGTDDLRSNVTTVEPVVAPEGLSEQETILEWQAAYGSADFAAACALMSFESKQGQDLLKYFGSCEEMAKIGYDNDKKEGVLDSDRELAEYCIEHSEIERKGKTTLVSCDISKKYPDDTIGPFPLTEVDGAWRISP